MNNFESVIFNIDINKRQPQPGTLLVAEPFLREQYFNHAVICLIDYEKGKGSMGIVLNRITNYTLNSILDRITVKHDIPVFCGGPMSCDRLYFLHTLDGIIPDSREIRPGLHIGGNFEAMLDYINSGYPIEGKIRFFIGYSGWDIGQLDDELRKNVWAVTDIHDNSSLLTGKENQYWHNHVRTMGDDYRGWLFHPLSPTMN